MPLEISSATPITLHTSLTQTATSTTPTYLVVYASAIDGRMWCGDCRDAEPLINKKFADAKDVVTVVYAGAKEEWRKPDNVWRQPPFSITALPTLVKVTGTGEMEKLVEEDCYNQAKLDAFVGR